MLILVFAFVGCAPIDGVIGAAAKELAVEAVAVDEQQDVVLAVAGA